jgi:hypothetical protein
MLRQVWRVRGGCCVRTPRKADPAALAERRVWSRTTWETCRGICAPRRIAVGVVGSSPWLRILVAGIIAAYCAAVAAAVAVTPVQAGQVRLFMVLLACSAVAVEFTRRIGEPSGVIRDVYAIWDLPAAVLLPPLYALAVPVPRMILMQVRVRRRVVHRRAYTAAAVGLAYAAVSLVFHSVEPALGAGMGTPGRALLWTVLTAGCGLFRLAVNDALVLTAVKGSAPETRLFSEIVGLKRFTATSRSCRWARWRRSPPCAARSPCCMHCRWLSRCRGACGMLSWSARLGSTVRPACSTIRRGGGRRPMR